MEACLENEETDGVLVILTPQTMTQGTETAKVLADMSMEWRERHKPLLTSFMGGKELTEAQEILRNAQIPNFAFSDVRRKAAAFERSFYFYFYRRLLRFGIICGDITSTWRVFIKFLIQVYPKLRIGKSLKEQQKLSCVPFRRKEGRF